MFYAAFFFSMNALDLSETMTDSKFTLIIILICKFEL